MSTALVDRIRIKLEGGGHGALAARIFGSGLTAVVIKIAAAGFGYLMFVVLARLLNQAEYGKFAFAFNLAIVLSTVAGLGATTAIMRFWPEYTVKGQAALARGALNGGARWTFLASGAAGLAVAASPLLLAWFRLPGQGMHLFMAGLLVPGFALSEYASAALRAHGITLWSLAPRDVFWRASVPLVAAIAAWRGLALDAASVLFIAAGLLLAITALQTVYALRVFGPARKVENDWPAWRRASGYMWGAAVLYVLVQQFDVVIAGFVLSPVETGSYFAAQKTAALLTLMLVAGNLVAAPLISAYYHKGDAGGLQRLCGYLAIGIAIPTVLGLGFVVIAGHWLLGLFDASFAEAYPILLILAAAATFDSLAGPTSYFLQMSGRESFYLKVMAITYVGVVALQFLLAPRFGALGIALPTAVGVIAWNAITVLKLRRETGVDPSVFGLFFKPSPGAR